MARMARMEHQSGSLRIRRLGVQIPPTLIFSRLSGHPLSLHWLCKVLPRTKDSKEPENRSGLLVVYGIGSKTVDYLCLLAGLSTVAVDPQAVRSLEMP